MWQSAEKMDSGFRRNDCADGNVGRLRRDDGSGRKLLLIGRSVPLLL